jgi:hypothetical protein
MTVRKLATRSSINPNAGKIRGLYPVKGTIHLIDEYHPPETKHFPVGDGIEQFDLLEEDGFTTKTAADKRANEWRAYPKDARARVVKIKDRYYVYGN